VSRIRFCKSYPFKIISVFRRIMPVKRPTVCDSGHRKTRGRPNCLLISGVGIGTDLKGAAI
jgi:hypothetical protein